MAGRGWGGATQLAKEVILRKRCCGWLWRTLFMIGRVKAWPWVHPSFWKATGAAYLLYR